MKPGSVPPQGTLRVRVDENQRTLRLRAIERVVRERHALRWIPSVLTDTPVAPPAEIAWDPPADLRLTDGQRRAMAGATSSPDIFLIQGPPGTGKTTVISALVRFFAGERGARVLLTSKGHRAIDNALERLGSADLHVLRLGQAGKVTGAGQWVLLTELLAQAEKDVPQRQLFARIALEDWLASLTGLEQILTEAHSLSRHLDESEVALAERAPDVLDGEATGGVKAVRQERMRLVRPIEPRWAPTARPAGRAHTAAVNSLLEPVRRFVRRARQRHAPQIGQQDLTSAGEQIALLQADQQLRMRLDAVLSSVAGQVCGLRLPAVSVATADEIGASLSAVRRVRGQASAALRELRAWGSRLEQQGAVTDVLIETVDVIAATAIGVNSGRDGARTAELDFDVAIVDEASQAQLTDLIVPLSRARTVVLVGDHQQLPPYLDDDLLRRCQDKGIDTTWLETSVFERLWTRLPDSHRTRLDMQFRMPEVIAGFLGRVFYGDDLASDAAKHGGGAVCGLFQSAVAFVDTSGAADGGEAIASPGFANRCEARLAADIAAQLPPRYRTGEGLGVIAPYIAQVTMVRQAMADALGLAPRDAWLIDNIATVDSFQGQERDVVIVSLTRSNPDGAVGFLTDLKRLNVTLSRARQQLVIIGDLSTLGAAGGGRERQAFAHFVRDLADHVREHGELLDVGEVQRRLERA